MAWQFGGFFLCFYQVIAIIIVATIVVKWVLLLLPFLVFLVIRHYKRSIPSFTQTSRVESMIKSPIISFMGETIAGVSTIRAFRK
jgi:hypothetical protein